MIFITHKIFISGQTYDFSNGFGLYPWREGTIHPLLRLQPLDRAFTHLKALNLSPAQISKHPFGDPTVESFFWFEDTIQSVCMCMVHLRGRRSWNDVNITCLKASASWSSRQPAAGSRQLPWKSKRLSLSRPQEMETLGFFNANRQSSDELLICLNAIYCSPEILYRSVSFENEIKNRT